jgi:hypothetical protein
MNEHNPFAALMIEDEDPRDLVGGNNQPKSVSWKVDEYRVEGNLLVCGSLCKLPRICVYTGDVDNLEQMETRRTHVCIHWYQSRRIGGRQHLRRLLFLLFAVTAMGSPLVDSVVVQAFSGDLLVRLAVSISPSLLAVTLIRLLRCPEQLWLNIARNDSFDTFYIEGFSDEYLRRLQSLQAQPVASSHPG